ncbi:TPA: hypothetical protein KNN56_001712 [Clostridioides difficile]|uniref:hypothetical protein n=1 Tax=Clostridioides difficile TaxID=1496 RepID=UPI00038CADC6|nr:hypothetical protein [Clostridioides difficile]EGT4625298.1 hypothetical protein [Clostridioides difficile]ELX4576091.1 hypothetical protein [Clostridioides difficile]EQK76205.1 hypothetical protein QEE_1738 [Clostridioides difficile CD113]MBH6986687.1 hypothetical protein [Clostridioides difficile]MBH7139393.1 hypothetical protein [Clostridioides difficile]
MEKEVINYILQLAEDVNSLVMDLGPFGLTDEDEVKKTLQDRILETYQWLSEPKGCKEASEYFEELLAILDKSDADYQRIADICKRIHKVQETEPWKEKVAVRKSTGCRR